MNCISCSICGSSIQEILFQKKKKKKSGSTNLSYLIKMLLKVNTAHSKMCSCYFAHLYIMVYPIMSTMLSYHLQYVIEKRKVFGSVGCSTELYRLSFALYWTWIIAFVGQQNCVYNQGVHRYGQHSIAPNETTLSSCNTHMFA